MLTVNNNNEFDTLCSSDDPSLVSAAGVCQLRDQQAEDRGCGRRVLRGRGGHPRGRHQPREPRGQLCLWEISLALAQWQG